MNVLCYVMMALLLFCCCCVVPASSSPVNNEQKSKSEFKYLPDKLEIRTNEKGSHLGFFSIETSFKRIATSLSNMFLSKPGKPVVELSHLTERCGNTDHDYNHSSRLGIGQAKRVKRYVLDDSKWGKGIVLYKIIKYSKKLSALDTERIIQRAFKLWAMSTHITFKRASRSEKADINISFVTGKHGDFQAMDGKGGILAHAYPPKYGGAIHFDDDEDWVAKGGHKGVVNFYQVAVHEIGHALGMGHSRIESAVMFPSYKGYEPNFKLARDDINGIQAKYGGFFYKGIMDNQYSILP